MAPQTNPKSLSREHILKLGQTLQAAPRIIASLCDLLQDLNTDLEQIALEIRSDPTLTARVVRVGNSVIYSGGSEVNTVEDALNRVGFDNVLSLVGAAYLATTNTNLESYGISTDALQQSLLFHGIAAECVARHAGTETQPAYLSGLLRGLGMIALDHSDLARDGEPFNLNKHASYRSWELDRYGITSSDATRILLDDWQFPNAVVTGIDRQALNEPDDLNNQSACIVNVAGAIVASYGSALPGETNLWQLTPEKLAGAGISAETWERTREEAKTKFDELTASL